MDSTNLFLNYENNVLLKDQATRTLPITLITGFLGSGKTTLLRHIFNSKLNLRLVLAVNDVAPINIDHELVSLSVDGLDGLLGDADARQGLSYKDGTSRSNGNSSKQILGVPDSATSTSKDNEVIGISDGCACCSALDTLKSTVWQFLSPDELAGGIFDYMVIETSGVSDPLAIVQLLEQRFGKMTRARLDVVVTVLDCERVATDPSFYTTNPVAASQIKTADVILLNKVDLVEPERADKAIAFLKENMAPNAKLVPTKYCKVPLELVMDVEVPVQAGEAIAHEKGLTQMFIPKSLSSRQSAKRVSKTGAAATQAGVGLQSGGFDAMAFSTHSPFLLYKLRDWLKLKAPSTMLRCKGLVSFVEDPTGIYELNVTGKRVQFERAGSRVGTFVSRLVVIGTDFLEEEIRKQLQACCIKGHETPAPPSEDSCAVTSSKAESTELHERWERAKKCFIQDAACFQVFDTPTTESLSSDGEKGTGSQGAKTSDGSNQAPPATTGSIIFSLVLPTYEGTDAADLWVAQGVHLSEVTKSFREEVHMSGIPALFFFPPGESSDGEKMGLSLAGEYDLIAEDFVNLQKVAESVLHRYSKSIHVCRSGH